MISIVGIIGACVSGLFLWVYIDTAGSSKIANDFLASVSQNNLDDAYKQTSDQFRLNQTKLQFLNSIQPLEIYSFSLEPWQNRTINHDGHNTYKGMVVTRSKQSIPFWLGVIIENNEWRIENFTDEERKGIGPGAWFLQLPIQNKIHSLVQNTVRSFGASIRNKDFTDFRKDMWLVSHGYTVENLENDFQQFLDENIDMSDIQTIDETYITSTTLEPNIDLGPMLLLIGRLPTDSGVVPFKFKYAYAHPQWKLNYIFLRPPGGNDFQIK